MFNPKYLEVQGDWCSACSSCNTCMACASCAVCLADGPIPDAEVGAVGAAVEVGNVAGVAAW